LNSDGGHVEYCSKIANPIGLKVGPMMKPSSLVRLCQRLDPHREAGRLTLITRLGYANVDKLLPPLIRALQDAGLTHVLWCCDPMHGNTYQTESGVKTRDFEHILSELQSTFHVHQLLGMN
jgi:3-deoxy-7-phosphoheptulonate synthase